MYNVLVLMFYFNVQGDDQGRAFINVVDIDSSALDDIVSSVPEKTERPRQFVDMKGSPTRERFRSRSPAKHRETGMNSVYSSHGKDNKSERMLCYPDLKTLL